MLRGRQGVGGQKRVETVARDTKIVRASMAAFASVLECTKIDGRHHVYDKERTELCECRARISWGELNCFCFSERHHDAEELTRLCERLVGENGAASASVQAEAIPLSPNQSLRGIRIATSFCPHRVAFHRSRSSLTLPN